MVGKCGVRRLLQELAQRLKDRGPHEVSAGLCARQQQQACTNLTPDTVATVLLLCSLLCALTFLLSLLCDWV